MRIWVLWVLITMGCGPQKDGPWAFALSHEAQDPVRGLGELSVRSTPLHIGIVSSAAYVTDGSSLRVEVRSPLGMTQIVVLIANGQWSIRIPETKLHLVARDANQTVLSLTDGVVSLSALQHLLLGRFDWVPASLMDNIRTVQNTNPVLIPFSNGAALRLTLDTSQQYLGRCTILSASRDVLLDVSYAQFRNGKPHLLEVSIPRVQMTVSLSMRTLSSFDPTDQTFQLSGQHQYQTVAMEEMWPVVLDKLLQKSDP